MGYPDGTIDELGASVTPDDLMGAQHVFHLGTIAAMAGDGLAGPAIKLLGRDLDRMQGDIRISRR